MLKNYLKKILDKGIGAEVLKIIAIITMVIDHVGFYFQDFLPYAVYSLFRNIGRIAMPIFVYLLVQGFFYTKSLKKYFTRVALTSIVTQIIFIVLGLLNLNIDAFESYTTNIYNIANILFSFSICLILMYIIHHNILVQKWDKRKNLLLKMFIVLAIIAIYVFVPIDYGFVVPSFALTFYAIERLKITVMLNRQNGLYNIQSMFSKSISEDKIKYIYKGLLALTIFVIVIYNNMNICTLLSILPLIMYNGFRKAGKNSSDFKGKIHRYSWYIFFPLHHFILYLLAMVLIGI